MTGRGGGSSSLVHLMNARFTKQERPLHASSWTMPCSQFICERLNWMEEATLRSLVNVSLQPVHEHWTERRIASCTCSSTTPCKRFVHERLNWPEDCIVHSSWIIPCKQFVHEWLEWAEGDIVCSLVNDFWYSAFASDWTEQVGLCLPSSFQFAHNRRD